MQVSSSSSSTNRYVSTRKQRRRGTVIFLFFKSMTVSFTLLLLHFCFLLFVHHPVYAFQLQHPSPTTVSTITPCPAWSTMRRLPLPWLFEASNNSLQRMNGVVSRTTALSSRLFSSVATNTVDTATNVNAAADTTRMKTQAVVELKYMEYIRHAEGAQHQAPPVVFLHGLLGNKKNFATIATSLGNQLKKKRRIIGLDLRNHGDNHHDWRDSMNYSEMAQDLLAFLDAQNIPKAVLVGHSMGGKVAQAVALTEPSRVDGLVVLDIAPAAYSNDEPHWKAVQDIVTVLATIPVGPGVTRRDVDVQLRSAIPDPALRAFCLTNFDAAKGEWKIHIQGICAQLDEIASFDISPSAGTSSPAALNNGKEEEDAGNQEQPPQHQYSGDAFFIHGGQSRFVRHAYIPAIQSYFPNHMLTTVRGAGHWIHAEKPEDTIALLKRFLER